MKRSHAVANLGNGNSTLSKRRQPIKPIVLSSDSESDAFESRGTHNLGASDDSSSHESRHCCSLNLIQKLQQVAFEDFKSEFVSNLIAYAYQPNEMRQIGNRFEPSCLRQRLRPSSSRCATAMDKWRQVRAIGESLLLQTRPQIRRKSIPASRVSRSGSSGRRNTVEDCPGAAY
ncbi:hypothetical protein N657DRAFT_186292 [Parathielavia appendiculata]|uniref:Uncharacterized protein n=1 Tax=Parathielavia appendiculata TaxID=2587402 RepID=A0AAN6U5V3_9PEZI|nr:hypothetical protein N657DRAFT_186292 [Parathielavia appendiculata]